MGRMAHPLKIRAHHLLCMLGFRGLGYSPEFIAMMGRVIGELNSNSTLPITIVAECDIICTACPHHKENKCVIKADFDSNVKARDLEVLQKLGLEAGTQIPVAEAWERLKNSLSVRDIVVICRDCEWLESGYCAEGLEKLAAGWTGRLDAGEGI